MHSSNDRGLCDIAKIVLCSVLLAAPLCAMAAGLDDLMNQATNQKKAEDDQRREAAAAEAAKQKQKELAAQGIGVEPYSLLQILKLASFMMLGWPPGQPPVLEMRDKSMGEKLLLLNGAWNMSDPKIQAIVQARLGEPAFDRQRALAFGITNFGSEQVCKGQFNPFIQSSLASKAVGGTLLYLNYSALKNEEKKAKAATMLTTVMGQLAGYDTRSEYEVAIKMESSDKSCPNAVKEKLLGNVKALVDAMLKNEAAIIGDANAVLAEAQSINKQATDAQEQKNKQASAAYAEKMAQQGKLNAEAERLYRDCRASKGYNLYALSNAIVNDTASLQSNQAVISHEKQVAAVSGYENKEVMYKAGQRITYLRDEIASLFAKYQQNGGSAGSPSDVQSVPVDPCAKLR